jgi:VWFA-related protein
MRIFPGLLLAALLLPNPALPQERPAAPRTSASVELNLFNLDVVVTDPEGRPVHGLTARDFEVRHDGKAVAISNFSEIRGEAFPSATVRPPEPVGTGAPAAVEPAAPRPPRRVVLFFDRLQLPDAKQRGELFDSIRGFLEELGESDEAMIVTWDRSIRTVLPFTNDPEKLESSLALVERKASRIAAEKADLDLLQDEDAWFTALALDPRIGTDFGGFTPTAALFAQQAFFEMKAKTAALRGLTATLGGMDGRKVLVLVSHRFSRYAGLEFFLRARTGVEALGDPQTKEFDTKRLLEDVTRSANANGVTLYAVFPAGMDAPQPSAADSVVTAPSIGSPALGGREQLAVTNEMEALSFIAEKTGGVAAVGAGSIPAFVDRVSADLDSWYSLGYPGPSGANRAASVTVRVPGRKVTVRVRGSLVEKTAEEQMRDRVLAHLFQPDGRARIPITASATAAAGQKGKFRIRVEIRIPISSLALLPTAKGVAGAFSVFVASVAPEGDFSDVSRRTQSFEIAAGEVETAKAGHYTYELEIESSGPEARVCVGVWDEKSNDAGFAVVKPSAS